MRATGLADDNVTASAARVACAPAALEDTRRRRARELAKLQ
jgi:hypothetical protein